MDREKDTSSVLNEEYIESQGGSIGSGLSGNCESGNTGEEASGIDASDSDCNDGG